jgi:stearoyl-CoA desaturase (Delta-9 desaturase)
MSLSPAPTPPGAAGSEPSLHSMRPSENPPRPDEMPVRSTMSLQVINLLAVTVPMLGFIATAALVWGRGFDFVQLGIFLTMFFLTAFGVTIGFHRLYTHRSFQTSAPVRWALAVLGSMAVEGPLRRWVATHRQHHQHSDDHHDPHSPHLHGAGFGGMLRGMWHAHVGWLFEPELRGMSKYVGDLSRDPVARHVSRLFVVWVLLGLAIPTVAGGLLTMSWWGAFMGFMWGGLARIFLVHHVTWSINSVCHIWGSRPFRSHDESRNNIFFGVFAFGEGWHNNHHAFPTSARHGLQWWQIDISYMIIRAMALVGLVWDVKVPDAARIASKLANPNQPEPAEGSTT